MLTTAISDTLTEISKRLNRKRRNRTYPRVAIKHRAKFRPKRPTDHTINHTGPPTITLVAA